MTNSLDFGATRIFSAWGAKLFFCVTLAESSLSVVRNPNSFFLIRKPYVLGASQLFSPPQL